MKAPSTTSSNPSTTTTTTATPMILATCGAGAVDAAYSLDPQTGGWLGWFAGRPDISNLTALAQMQGIITLGG